MLLIFIIILCILFIYLISVQIYKLLTGYYKSNEPLYRVVEIHKTLQNGSEKINYSIEKRYRSIFTFKDDWSVAPVWSFGYSHVGWTVFDDIYRLHDKCDIFYKDEYLSDLSWNISDDYSVIDLCNDLNKHGINNEIILAKFCNSIYWWWYADGENIFCSIDPVDGISRYAQSYDELIDNIKKITGKTVITSETKKIIS